MVIVTAIVINHNMNNNNKKFLFRNKEGNEMCFEARQTFNISAQTPGGPTKINYIFDHILPEYSINKIVNFDHILQEFYSNYQKSPQ